MMETIRDRAWGCTFVGSALLAASGVVAAGYGMYDVLMRSPSGESLPYADLSLYTGAGAVVLGAVGLAATTISAVNNL